MSSPTPPVASLLVVDDSAVQRERTVQTCRELGVPLIYEAASGAEALALLRHLVLTPDLMIVDLEMPGMDGIELIQQLLPQGLALPLIVASGQEKAVIDSVETLACHLGLAVLPGLKKPLSTAALGAALAELGSRTAAATSPPVAPGPAIDAQALAAAIADGSIGVHYQPKVDMRTGIVRGVEALARWPHGGGFVPPDRFVALPESEGLIHALTLSVLRQALAQAADWNAHGLRLSMAVNLSPRLLDRAQLVQEVTDLVAEHGLRPDQVVLEITESSVVDCMGAALGVLARLRLKGFGLSIDDYGTGFSSLQQLARIPFTELKIDRSFVHGALQRRNLRVILRSALDMARQLGLVTVAEGVETLEDWRLLQALGCSVGQGHLIARAMPADELPAWLRRHQSILHELRAEAANETL
ncbi:EAL domain-containing response regulator [Rubrivivax gelatinosus]|uniref:Diguanylate cyclase n=1 Tax=Rubrivivax gelatinosus TaxID=28068 RepID=A0ABS1DU56_RUBGE|nr:EAL domain-containing response regulator [Rubrivivax gelatinosus]MBK1712909.1 diguanylate cyclase [Rubrivivax gelatinosus]